MKVPEGTEQEFRARGIPSQRVIPMGIPVRQGFRKEMSREKAVESLGLAPDKRYILLAGGSIGAGKILQAEGNSRYFYAECETRESVCGG